MRMRIAVLVALLYLPGAVVAEAQSLPVATPEQVGLSSERLSKITATLRADVEKGLIPGAILLVGRHGKVALFDAVGARDPATKAPMTKDSIFRIYSMSKPITSVAAMLLFEEGKFSLADPVSKYIPQLGGLKVGIEKPDPSGGKPTLELVPSRRDMTIQDLFRHTSGLTYGFFGEGLVKRMYVETKVWNDYPSNAELIDRLAKLPLAYQPGTTWDYSHSTDVLGRVIEVLSSKSLYQFEKERLLDPLGLKDTSFYVSDKGKQDRIAEAFAERSDLRYRCRLQRPARRTEVGVGRGRHGQHGHGLCALPPDVAQRRRARRQADPGPEDRGVHGRRPPGPRDRAGPVLSAGRRVRLRPRLRGAEGRRRVALSRVGR